MSNILPSYVDLETLTFDDLLHMEPEMVDWADDFEVATLRFNDICECGLEIDYCGNGAWEFRNLEDAQNTFNNLESMREKEWTD